MKAPDTSRARVLVVGDVMLDRYWYGDATRISPEAPVPVVLWQREEERLGGAANVARNCAALGAPTRLLSVTGRDEAGERVAALLKAEGVSASLRRDPSLRTTQKLRVVHRKHQLLRIDMETPPSKEVLASKLADFRKALPDCDVVLLSDYGKGGLAHVATMIREARRAKKTVLVDPKGGDWSRYRGASLITPNLKELEDVVGPWRDERDLAQRAQALRARLRLDSLLLPRSVDGMTLYRKGRAVRILGQ
jgi:rfaE bifunctional protein kinase chain/domain